MLGRWSRFVMRRRWLVVAAWAVVVASFVAMDSRTTADFVDQFSIPGSDSQRARDLLQARFPAEAGSTATLVVHAPRGLNGPIVRGRVETVVEELRRSPRVASVTTPYDNRALVSRDGRTGLATIRFDDGERPLERSSIGRLVETAKSASSPDLQFELSGQAVRRYERSGPGQAEAVGLTAAIVVLLIAFGSVVAMGLPVTTALVGLVCGFSLITLLSTTTNIPSAAPSFATMLGLGVGIDYALFIVTRFREGIAGGATVEQALETAMTTAGKAVLVAGTAVIIALLGLYLVGIPIIASLGLVAAIVVALAVAVGLSLLPALLAIAGRRVDFLSVRRRPGSKTDCTQSGLYRMARLVQRFPLVALGLSLALLGTLALPLLDIQLGAADDGHAPASTTSRRAFDLQSSAFGEGFSGTLIIVLERPSPLSTDVLMRVRKAIAEMDGVVAVSPASLSPDGTTAVFTVTPASGPQSRETRALVDGLREETLPAILGRADPQAAAHVTGPTAAMVDVTERMESRLLPFFAAVVGLSVLLLMVAFRSLAVPLKAAVLNFGAIGAALGVSVAVFQWGWAGRAAGIERTGPIESFLPMIVFAVLFGLSMDYEVFLVSRIRERFLQTGDASEAIAYGVASSGRVISAAAAILVVVFSSFLLSDQRMMKEFGLTQAVAILIDATVVRMVMVPAGMELLGRWSWWLPGWLDSLLPWWDLEHQREEKKSLTAWPAGAQATGD